MKTPKKGKPFRHIIIRCSIFCFLLPLLFFWLLLFVTSMDVIRDNALSTHQSLTTLMGASVDKELDKMEQDLETVCLETSVQQHLITFDSLPYGAQMREAYLHFDRLFAQMRATKSSAFETAYLVTEKGFVYTNEYVPTEVKRQKAANEWYEAVRRQRGRAALVDVTENGKGQRLLTVGRLVLDREKYAFIGAVFLSYPIEALTEALGADAMQQDSLILLTDMELNPLYENREPDGALLSAIRENAQTLLTEGSATINRQPVLCEVSKGQLKLAVVNAPPLSKLYGRLFTEQGGIFVGGAVCIILFAFSTFYCYRKLYRPLREILSARQKEPSPEQANSYDCYELNEIDNTISTLIKKNQDGNEEVVRLINRNDTITIDKLQSQLNPHFLYNTLTTIKYIAIKNQQEEISQVITSLVKLLRSTINRDGSLIPLEQELENVSHYILIENVVYNGNIGYSCQVPEGLKAAMIPNFILQPLLENSIFHGIHPEHGGGKITVRAEAQGDDLLLQVCDNGDGFPKDNLLDVLSGGGDASGHMTNLGLKAVHQKIQLLCGKKYGLTIYSNKQEGAAISILLPLNGGDGKP